MAGNKKRKKSRKKHCNSKREVFQMVQDHINEKHPQQSRNICLLYTSDAADEL